MFILHLKVKKISEKVKTVGTTVLNTRYGQASLDLADNVVMYAHDIVDVALPPSNGDHTNRGKIFYATI